MEIWKDVTDFKGHYQVSNRGRVRSLKFGRIKILKQYPNPKGYQIVWLFEQGKRRGCTVHRLVCELFIGHSSQCVNHMDGDTSNNKLENLEYCSQAENIAHGHRLRGKKRGVWKDRNKYCAVLSVKNKRHYLGSAHTKEEAYKLYYRAYLIYYEVPPW